MEGSQKSKRVAWASDANLCQVKLFLSQESPSQVGLATQDHLQAKISGPFQGNGINLPPGFEGMQAANLWRGQLSQIPSVIWRCPPRFQVDNEWAVVAGEESLEIEVQNQRQMRVLEAIHPRLSAIPPNPSALMGVDDASVNNQNPPLIPITPIEDEDPALNTYISTTAIKDPTTSHHQHMLQHSIASNKNLVANEEPDIVAPAPATLTSIMPNNDQGNLIDRELLIKILSDPTMIGQLLTNHGVSSAAQNAPSSIVPDDLKGMPALGGQTCSSSTEKLLMSLTPKIPSWQSMAATVHNVSSPSTQFVPSLLKSSPKNLFDSLASGRSDTALCTTYISEPEAVSSLSGPTSLSFNPTNKNLQPYDTIPHSSQDSVFSMVKDTSYYKSLIQQHGEERQENAFQFTHQSSHAPGTKLRDLKHKTMKACIFFNSPRGCRNGVNCPYLHDAYPQQKISSIPKIQSAKRMKIYGETE